MMNERTGGKGPFTEWDGKLFYPERREAGNSKIITEFAVVFQMMFPFRKKRNMTFIYPLVN